MKTLQSTVTGLYFVKGDGFTAQFHGQASQLDEIEIAVVAHTYSGGFREVEPKTAIAKDPHRAFADDYIEALRWDGDNYQKARRFVILRHRNGQREFHVWHQGQEYARKVRVPARSIEPVFASIKGQKFALAFAFGKLVTDIASSRTLMTNL